MRIIFIRHGDPDYELDSLTEKGRREAALVAKRVKEINPDYVYSSPLGRAELTCKYSQKECGFNYEVLPWLREFPGMAVDKNTGKPMYPWDLKPNFFVKQDELYDASRWRDNEMVKTGDVLARYDDIAEGLNALLEKHGYKKDGRLYRAVRPNRDTIVIFCHYAVTAVMMSILTSHSPYVFWQHFCALTTSVTTFATEERDENAVSFRCIGFGEIGHLTEHGEPPSFAARFCETFDSDERH